MNSINTRTNFDDLLLRTLMGRLQIRPTNNPVATATQSLDDLLFDTATSNLSDEEEEDDKTQLAKEESKLEKDIIRVVLSGNTESLNPNSGQAVTINDHHICVGFTEETDSDYRVWEWHGHIMLFDEENGYTPEYIYGNYFQRLLHGKGHVESEKEDGEEEEEEDIGDLGLKELINGGESSGRRILHRNFKIINPLGLFFRNSFIY